MPTPEEIKRVGELLGRAPQGEFEVVVVDEAGDPLVIRNAPLLADGSPMPTLYWLVGKEARQEVSRLESNGGVKRAEAEVDPRELAEAHLRYAAERDALIDPSHSGPRPSGGVGGTRLGVKCLHAHYAYHLAGGDDPVGRWVANQLSHVRALTEPFIDSGKLNEQTPQTGDLGKRSPQGGELSSRSPQAVELCNPTANSPETATP